MGRPAAIDVLARYKDAKTLRAPYESDWRIAAAHCSPRDYAAWGTTGPAHFFSGQDGAARVAFDSSGLKALPRYMALLERMCTPHDQKWQTLMADNPELMRIRRVRQYFDDLDRVLFKGRYNGHSQFRRAVSEMYLSMGVYGTAPMYTGVRTPNALYSRPSPLYKACHLRDVFILINAQGEVDTVFRRMWLNYRQFKQMFPNEPTPKCFREQETRVGGPKENEYKEIVHVVHPRDDYDPRALNARRHKIVGSYLDVEGQEYIGKELGYRSLPYIVPRDYTSADSPYGYSPAVKATPAMGTASAMKKTMIKQGQKAVDPVILAHDDGVVNGPIDLRPGKVNYGAVDSKGNLLVNTLPTGNLRLGKDMVMDERADISDFFFASIFNILEETSEMKATQVMDRISKEHALLSPVMGAMQSEFLAILTRRDIDINIELGKIADSEGAPGIQMPPELIEAEGEYEIVYTSPMAKGQYAEEVSGFMRAVQSAAEVVSLTGDASHMDHFNFGRAIPEMADRLNVPAGWMNDEATKDAISQQRQQQQQQEMLVKNAGPIAGAAKTLAAQ